MGGRPLRGAPEAPSAHFLNNVLACAASYVDEDPDLARDVLAHLGQYLAYRLRDDLAPVPLAEEVAFTATYLRLEQARFPDRLHLELPDGPVEGPDVEPLTIQAPVADLLERRLRERSGALRARLRVAGGRVRLDVSGWPDAAEPERLVVPAGAVAA